MLRRVLLGMPCALVSRMCESIVQLVFALKLDSVFGSLQLSLDPVHPCANACMLAFTFHDDMYRAGLG